MVSLRSLLSQRDSTNTYFEYSDTIAAVENHDEPQDRTSKSKKWEFFEPQTCVIQGPHGPTHPYFEASEVLQPGRLFVEDFPSHHQAMLFHF